MFAALAGDGGRSKLASIESGGARVAGAHARQTMYTRACVVLMSRLCRPSRTKGSGNQRALNGINAPSMESLQLRWACARSPVLRNCAVSKDTACRA